MSDDSNTRKVTAAIRPYQKESTYTNIFSLPVILWVSGYVFFNFYLEWNNWDKLLKEASTVPKTDANATALERWMVVDLSDTAAIGIVRLQEVCNQLDVFDAVFALMCVVIPLMSIVRFVLRQQKVLYESVKCKNSFKWFTGFVFLGALRALEAFIAFFLITMVLPSSFLMCYRLVAMYYCTLIFGLFIGFLIVVVLTSAVSHTVLVFDVKYTSLGVIGKEQEIDVIQTKRRKRSRRKYKDEEGDGLIENEDYSDGLTEEDKTYIDNTV